MNDRPESCSLPREQRLSAAEWRARRNAKMRAAYVHLPPEKKQLLAKAARARRARAKSKV